MHRIPSARSPQHPAPPRPAPPRHATPRHDTCCDPMQPHTTSQVPPGAPDGCVVVLDAGRRVPRCVELDRLVEQDERQHRVPRAHGPRVEQRGQTQRQGRGAHIAQQQQARAQKRDAPAGGQRGAVVAAAAAAAAPAAGDDGRGVWCVVGAGRPAAVGVEQAAGRSGRPASPPASPKRRQRSLTVRPCAWQRCRCQTGGHPRCRAGPWSER